MDRQYFGFGHLYSFANHATIMQNNLNKENTYKKSAFKTHYKKMLI